MKTKIVALSVMTMLWCSAQDRPVQANCAEDFQPAPLFLSGEVPPLVMLIMERDHKLYYEAYNDAADLNGDGVLDVGYNPAIDYYGYFDCYKCYDYDPSAAQFNPVSTTTDKKCSGHWSGDFLNYVTMSRMDTLRKVLYGGYRSTDTETETVLQRAYIPGDAHSWGKEYWSIERNGYDIREYTPLNLPATNTRHIFANTTLSDNGAPLLRVIENTVARVWEYLSIERPVARDQGAYGANTRFSITTNPTALFDWTHGGGEGISRCSSGSTTVAVGGIDATLGGLGAAAGFSMPFNAFDDNTNTNYSTSGTLPRAFIRFQFPAAQQIVSYIVTSSTNNVNYDPVSWKLEGSNNGSTWTTIDTVTNAGFTTARNETKTFDVDSPGAYTYYRLFVNSVKSGTNISISEMQLIAASDSTLALSDPNNSRSAFDDSNTTNWYTVSNPAATCDPSFYAGLHPEACEPVWIEFQFGQGMAVQKYTFTTAKNIATGLDPKAWKLFASNDGVHWTLVDTVEDGGLSSSRANKKSFICDTPPTQLYTYYRFYINERKNPAAPGVALGEIELMDLTDPPANATRTDYEVRVKVGVASMPETNCKQYPNGAYKPIGLLQRHGETGRMLFGLMTGSYSKNISGGVLRKNIMPFVVKNADGTIDLSKSEVNPQTGCFTSLNGIVSTINKIRIKNFSYTDNAYANCFGVGGSGVMVDNKCREWGNPIAEMMYESLRYFAGKKTPTTSFTYSGGDDDALGLPLPAWENPYQDNAATGYTGSSECAKPFMLVLSDINISYDSDQLPGTAFGSFTGDLAGLNVSTLGSLIGSNENVSGSYYIGQQGATATGTCTPKAVSGLGNIRGLCPEEPTKQGSYYAASVAYFGHTNDISPKDSTQKVTNYSVALSSPLPRIEIPVGNKTITLVPYAKSVNRTYGTPAFNPTNTIVDFYVQTVQPTYGMFRINYEDVEQGSDHDMDAISLYEYQVIDSDGNPVLDPAQGAAVRVTVTSQYAAGGIIQHMGYIISGTTAEGSYLEVRDVDTSAASDAPYGGLPLVSTRVFYPGTTGSADLLKDPLWYAAKWGGFDDVNENNLPDLEKEWDSDSNNTPDTYFYVVNPLKLEQQLNKSFADILKKAASGSAVSVLATKGEGEGTLVQAYFKQSVTDETGVNDASWIGYLQCLWVDPYGNIREDSNQNARFEITQDKIIEFYQDEVGDTKVKRYSIGSDPYSKTGSPENISLESIKPIWEAGKRLWERDADDRQIFTYTDTSGFIEFTAANVAAIKPYLDIADDTTCATLGDTPENRARNVINFIRGIPDDSPEYLGNPTLRRRTLTIDGQTHVWKLGDIVFSTPVSIAKPVENYGLIYDDVSYKEYLALYKNRETIVYAGANDGMLHAFSSGLYDDNATIKQFNPYSTAALGDELWAYVPKCQLPHLKMLAQTSYAGGNHLNFVDLKPRVFDAKIFPAGGAHPNGWGTILVCGMNLGGREITVTDPDLPGGVQTFSPSYATFDITVPQAPVFLWEKTFPGIGFTTTIPSVIKVKDKWFLVIGSGPTSEDGTSTQNGRVFIIDLATGTLLQTFIASESNSFMNSPVALDKGLNYTVDAIYVGCSYQSGGAWRGKAYKIAIPQLNATGQYDPLCLSCYDDNPLNWRWQPLFESPAPFYAPFTLSVDQRDNVWIFIGTGRYIASADRMSGDQQYLFGIKDPFFNRRGTVPGESFTPACYHDYDAPGCTITMSDIFDANPYRIGASGTVEIKSGYTDTLGLEGKSFDEFLSQGVKKKSTGANPIEIYQGWYRNLSVPPESCPCVCTAAGCTSATPCMSDLSCPAPCSRTTCTSSERVVNKPVAFGGIALFPTFTPVSDLCRFGGSSKLYGLYYESGTAYKKKVFTQADNSDAIQDVVSLGAGLASSPAIHAGKQQGQAGTALSQLSTGQIVQIEVTPAYSVKSGTQYWRESR